VYLSARGGRALDAAVRVPGSSRPTRGVPAEEEPDEKVAHLVPWSSSASLSPLCCHAASEHPDRSWTDLCEAAQKVCRSWTT
jgi:hypothetical protein